MSVIDRPERRDCFRRKLRLRHPRPIFVLANETHFGIWSQKAKLLGENSGKRAPRIVVGADHGRDSAVANLCTDARNLGNWVCGAVQFLRTASDQLLQASARIVVEHVVDTTTSKPRQLAMVAEGGTNDEHRSALAGSAFAAKALLPEIPH